MVAAALKSWLTGQRFRILMYHSVSEDEGDSFAVPPALLARQLAALAGAGYAFHNLRTALHLSRSRADLRRIVALTFDDGFDDFMSVLPMLDSCRGSATLFVPLGELGTTASWATPKRILSGQDVAAINAVGVEVGCHGYKHVRLPGLEAGELAAHLRRSIAIMEDLGLARPYGFAYPYGDVDGATKLRVQRAGFDYAAIAGGLGGNGPYSDRWSLVRIPVTRDLSPARLVRSIGRRGDIERLIRHFASRWRLPRAPRSSRAVRSPAA